MPRQGSSRINKALTNMSVMYKNEDYIARKVLKDIPVAKESDLYWIYANDMRVEETKRANGAQANMATWEASTSSYVAVEHAIKDVITETDRANTDAPLELDRDTVEYLTDKVMLREEYEAAKLLFTTTTFSNNTTLNTASSWKYNTTTSAPIQNVLSATGSIIKNGTVKPNTMIIGWEGFEALKENNNVYSRIQYVERAIVTEDLLSALFDLDMVYVGTAVYNGAKEGATDSMGFVWGSDAVVGYFAPRPTLKTKTAAGTFRATYKGSPMRVKKWFEDDVEGDFIEVQTKFVHKAIATSAAYLFKTVALS